MGKKEKAEAAARKEQWEIDELVKDADIDDVVCGVCGIPVVRSGTVNRFECRWHDDTNPSMFYRAGDTFAYCPVCQKGANAIELIERWMDVGFIEACDILANRQGNPNFWSNSGEPWAGYYLKPEDAEFIGLHLPGRINIAGRVWKHKPDPGTKKKRIWFIPDPDHYIEAKTVYLSWKDLLSQPDFAGMVITYALRTRNEYESLADLFPELKEACRQYIMKCNTIIEEAELFAN